MNQRGTYHTIGSERKGITLRCRSKQKKHGVRNLTQWRTVSSVVTQKRCDKKIDGVVRLQLRKTLRVLLPQVQSSDTPGNFGDFFIRKLFLEVRVNVLHGWILGSGQPSMGNQMLLDMPNLRWPGFLEVIMFPKLPGVLLLWTCGSTIPNGSLECNLTPSLFYLQHTQTLFSGLPSHDTVRHCAWFLTTCFSTAWIFNKRYTFSLTPNCVVSCSTTHSVAPIVKLSEMSLEFLWN